MTPALLFATPLLLALAGYAHYRLPFHAIRPWPVRLVLLVVGAAFGYTAAALYPVHSPLLVFLAGFGVVHVPAAVILFVKRARGEGKS